MPAPDALPAPGPAYPATRAALHAVAEHVVSAARVAATGHEIALEATPGGFGTPPDVPAPDGRVRVEGTDLVVDPGGARTPLTSLRAAGRAAGLAGAEALSAAPLGLDPDEAAVVAAVHALGAQVLAALTADADLAWDPSPVRLWPEHFDIAVEQGAEAAGARAAYGVSPGDEHHPEPYVYVAPWSAPPAGPAWDATGFAGAELGWAALRAEPDPHAAALAFLRARRALLVGA